MSGEMVPADRVVRMSDAERNGVIERLSAAVAEGRLTMTEFEERVDGVLTARTYGDVEPFLADLPTSAPRELVELRGNGGVIKRDGRWAVPRRLVVRGKGSMIKIDLRHAVIAQPVVEIELAAQGGSTTIVLPAGATADIDGVSTSAGTARLRVPSTPEPGAAGPHVVVTGTTAGGTLSVRHERRFWRWRW